ncbi:MAG TPA: phosphatidate cytidylyltransferase [Casimicrobiaceae bacterium]
MLKTRILTAAVLLPLTLAALFGLPPRGWGAVTLGVVAIAAHEWGHLAGYPKPARLAFVASTVALGIDLLFAPASRFAPDAGWPAAVTLYAGGAATLFWLTLAPAWLAAGWRVESKLLLALTGWLVLLAAWIAAVQLQARSPALLLATMGIVWIADTAAYFSGRAFGRHKLAPTVSPGKTWEGVYGALAATAVYALTLLWLAPEVVNAGALAPPALAGGVGLVVALAALSVVGDLFKSLLKRQRGLKDSGWILPGHGGVIDRIDALLAVMPPAALLAQYALR